MPQDTARMGDDSDDSHNDSDDSEDIGDDEEEEEEEAVASGRKRGAEAAAPHPTKKKKRNRQAPNYNDPEVQQLKEAFKKERGVVPKGQYASDTKWLKEQLKMSKGEGEQKKK